MSKENFKNFVRNNPNLVKYVKDNKKVQLKNNIIMKKY